MLRALNLAAPWWLAAMAFSFLTFVLNTFYPINVLIDNLKDIEPIWFFLFAFFSALLEGMFLITFYWPGTAILLGMAAISHGYEQLFSVVFAASAGTTAGAVITYYFFLKKIRNLVHVPQHNFIEVAEKLYLKFHFISSILMSVQPSFLSWMYAYAGFRHHSLRNHLYYSIPSVVIWFSIIGLIVNRMKNVIFGVDPSGYYIVSIIMFLIGLSLFVYHGFFGRSRIP